MKIAVWIVFGVMAALWTGGALLTSELAQWTAQALASGEAASLGRDVAQWPLPRWIGLWVDPAAVQAAQEMLLWAVETLDRSLPWVGSALGWLAPLVWVLWGLGLVAMLVLAGGAHLLLGRLGRTQPRAA